MRAIAIAACLLALAACGPESAPPEPTAGAEVAPASESEPAAGSQYEPIERAKAVEPEVLDAKKAQDAEIEAQGG